MPPDRRHTSWLNAANWLNSNSNWVFGAWKSIFQVEIKPPTKKGQAKFFFRFIFKYCAIFNHIHTFSCIFPPPTELQQSVRHLRLQQNYVAKWEWIRDCCWFSKWNGTTTTTKQVVNNLFVIRFCVFEFCSVLDSVFSFADESDSSEAKSQPTSADNVDKSTLQKE